MKIYLDVQTRKTGDGLKQAISEINAVEAKLRSEGHTVAGVKVKVRDELKKTAAAYKKYANDVDVASGRVVRAQKRMVTGAAGPGGRTPHSGAGGGQAFAGIGLLNYLSKVPGGGIAAPILGATGVLPGIGAAAAGIGAVIAATKLLGVAWDALVSVGTSLARTFVDITLQGYNYNAMLETTRAGTAAIISSFGDIVDVQNKAVASGDKFNAALQISSGIQDALRAAAIQTAASYEQLVRVFQEGAGPAISKGFTASQITRLTVDVAQVAQAIGLPFEQLNQEIRGLLEGDLSRNSRIARLILADLAQDAKAHGSTVEKELKKMAQLGTLPDYLHQRMVEFNKAAAITANTLPVAMSNLKDAFQQAMGQATADGTLLVTQRVRELTAAIVTFDQFGNAKFSEGFVRGLRAIGDAVTFVITKLIDVATRFEDFLIGAQAVGNLMKKNDLGPLNLTAPGAALRMGAVGLGYQDEVARLRKERAAQRQAADEEARLQAQAYSQMVLRGGASALGGKASARLNKVELFTGGLTRSAFEEELGRFRQSKGPLATVALIDQINKVTGENKKRTTDASLSLEEFSTAMQEASGNGFRLSGAVKSVGDETKKTDAAVASLLNKFEALSEKARSLSNSAADLSEKAGDLTTSFQREATTAGGNRLINELERQIAVVEEGAAGDPNNAQLEQIDLLKRKVQEQKNFLAEKKVEWDAADRDRKIADLDRERVELLAKRANIERDLNQLQAERERTKGAGTASAAIDAQINATIGALEAVKAQTNLIEGQITEASKAAAVTRGAEEREVAAANAEALQKISADTAKKKAENDEKANKLIRRQNERLMRELEKMWDKFADAFADGIVGAIETISSGGKLTDAMNEMFAAMRDGMFDTMREGLSGLFKDVVQIAKTGSYKDASGEVQQGFMSQKAAKGVAAGAIGASALATILNNGGSRGSNVANGIVTGAMAGAQIGVLVGHPIIGAIIGAIVGGIAGAFAKTARKVGFRFTGKNGVIKIESIGDVKKYELDTANRDFNKAVTMSRSAMLDIFTGLPTSVLQALTSNLQPKLPDFYREIEPVSQAGEAIADFLQTTVPQLVLQSYFPAIEETTKLLGANQDKANDLIRYLRTLDFTDAQKFVGQFFNQLAVLAEISDFGKMTVEGKMAFARNKLNQTVPQQLTDAGTRLAALVPKNFEQMPIEQQVEYAEKLLPAIQQAYDLALDYWAKIGQMTKDSLRAIDDQIFEYRLMDMDPQQQMNELLGRGRQIKDLIKQAATPEEVARLTQEYQTLIDRMVELAGGRPEDRAQAITALQDLRAITENRYKELADEAARAAQPLFDQITRILTALETGINIIVPREGVDPADPNGPRKPIDLYPIAVGTDEAAAGLASFAGALTNATAAVGSFAGGGGGPAPVVVPAPIVNITIEGDIGRVLRQWRSEVVQEAVQESARVADRLRVRSTRRS